MFAALRPARPRRSARFTPALDALGARIMPSDLIGTAPAPTPPPVEPTPIDPELSRLLDQFDRVCRSDATRI